MDNEKKNFSEQNTNGESTERDSAPITAEDLIRRLKSNIKQNPNLHGDVIFDEDVADVVETKAEAPEAEATHCIEYQPCAADHSEEDCICDSTAYFDQIENSVSKSE